MPLNTQTKLNQTTLSIFWLSALDRNDWYHITMCKQIDYFNTNYLDRTTMWNILALNKNTWNHTTVRKLFVLDRNSWYYMSVYRLLVSIIIISNSSPGF